MKDTSKKHHYVPQSMLRQFSYNCEEKQIYVFDKRANRFFLPAILDAGCENNFNAFEFQGETVLFERVFHENDTQLALLMNKILMDRSVANLTSEDRSALSAVVAAQIVRTKIMRTTMQDVVGQIAETLKEFHPEQAARFSAPTDQQIKRDALSLVRAT
jgi:hypothetical protein